MFEEATTLVIAVAIAGALLAVGAVVFMYFNPQQPVDHANALAYPLVRPLNKTHVQLGIKPIADYVEVEAVYYQHGGRQTGVPMRIVAKNATWLQHGGKPLAVPCGANVTIATRYNTASRALSFHVACLQREPELKTDLSEVVNQMMDYASFAVDYAVYRSVPVISAYFKTGSLSLVVRNVWRHPLALTEEFRPGFASEPFVGRLWSANTPLVLRPGEEYVVWKRDGAVTSVTLSRKYLSNLTRWIYLTWDVTRDRDIVVEINGTTLYSGYYVEKEMKDPGGRVSFIVNPEDDLLLVRTTDVTYVPVDRSINATVTVYLNYAVPVTVSAVAEYHIYATPDTSRDGWYIRLYVNNTEIYDGRLAEMLKTVDLPTGERLNIYVKPPGITVWAYHPYYKIRGSNHTLVLKKVETLSIGRIEAHPLGAGTAVYLNGVYKGVYHPKEKRLIHDTGWYEYYTCRFRETLWWDAQHAKPLYFKRESSSGCQSYETRLGVSPISAGVSGLIMKGGVTYEVKVRRNVLGLPWLSLRVAGVPVYDGPYADFGAETPMGYRVELRGGALKFSYANKYGNATVELTEGSGAWGGWVKFVDVPVPLVDGTDSYTVLAFPGYGTKTGFGFVTPDVAYGVLAREWMDRLYIHWYDPSCGLFDEGCLRNATLGSPGSYAVSINVPGMGVARAVVTWDGQNITIRSGNKSAAGRSQVWMPLAYYRDPTPAYRYVIKYEAEWKRVEHLGTYCGYGGCPTHVYLVKSRGYLQVYLNGKLVGVDAYVGEGVLVEPEPREPEPYDEGPTELTDTCFWRMRMLRNGTAFKEVRKEGDKVVLKVQDVVTVVMYNPCTGQTGRTVVFIDVVTVRTPQGNVWIADWKTGKTCSYREANLTSTGHLTCGKAR